MSAQQVISSTTQVFLDIFDITNDILILKDGSTALIITVNAMNFGLLAEPEQDAIMYAYAGLLNSLNYPIQIVIRSQTKDVTGYLGLLKEEEEKNTSDTKKRWIRKYREFVADLITERNVLDKKFYVVIPASALEMGLLPPSTVIPGIKQPDLTTVERSVILEKAQEILEPKRDHLMGQFGRIGLVSRQLQTQEIIQLFYLSYNPEAADGQQITDTSSYTAPLVKADIRGGFMDNMLNQTPVMTTPTTPTTLTVDPMSVLADPVAETPPQPIPTQVAPIQVVEPITPAAPAITQSPLSTGPTPEIPVITQPTASATTQVGPTIEAPTPVVPQMTMTARPTPPAVAAPAVVATPMAATTPSEADIQNAINSSLQQLGSVAPVATTPTMAGVGISSTTQSSVIPTPAPATTTSPLGSDLTPPQTSTDALPPLPEI